MRLLLVKPLCLFIALGLSAGCVQRKARMTCIKKPSFKKASTFTPDPTKPITILIHGTRLPPLLLATVPLLHYNVYTPQGLHKAADVSSLYLKARCAQALSISDPVNFPYENMYLFGWGGKLSFTTRKQAAIELYALISQLRQNPLYAKTPLTIITVSHGGNVALGMGSLVPEIPLQKPLVDRLILLCCPIQEATQYHAHKNAFNEVYHLFGSKDLIQTLDPQGWYNAQEMGCTPLTFFSQRVFTCPGDHIKQAEITCGKRSFGHASFSFPRFFRKIPHLLNTLKEPTSLKRSSTGNYILNTVIPKEKNFKS